jgi:hypothetical protein
MPSIASIGTVTAGAPRIEVGLLKTESPVLPRPRGAGPGEPRLISASASRYHWAASFRHLQGIKSRAKRDTLIRRINSLMTLI